MLSRLGGEEIGEVGFKSFESHEEVTTSIPVSQKSSRTSTPVSSCSTCSDSHQGITGPTSNFWSRRVSFLRVSLELRPKRQSKDVDDDFLLCRYFGHLQSRLLLEQQNELHLLEKQFDKIKFDEVGKLAYDLEGGRQNSPDKKRLLNVIQEKLISYHQLLLNMANMTAIFQPMTGKQKNVASWLWNVEPIAENEFDFLSSTKDLVTLRSVSKHDRLDQSIDQLSLWSRWASIRRVFQSNNTSIKSNKTSGSGPYTRLRVHNYVVTIITSMIIALILTPLWVLYSLIQRDISNWQNGTQFLQTISLECVGVLLLSTMAFSTFASLLTTAKRHEILAASAAYAAVLVVFVENLHYYQRLRQKGNIKLD